MKVGKLTQANAAVAKDLQKLLVALRSNTAHHKAPLSDVQKIVKDKNAMMVVALDEKKIVGMGTLYVLRKLGIRSAYVEDVVVDAAYRGQGLGEKIMQALIVEAKKAKVSEISLTSRPEREAANRLYQKLGFAMAKTNVYRLKL